jgi:hypothetical protein
MHSFSVYLISTSAPAPSRVALTFSASSLDTFSLSVEGFSKLHLFPFVSLFPLAPSGNFFNNWLSFVYYYPIAFYIYSINKSKN